MKKDLFRIFGQFSLKLKFIGSSPDTNTMSIVTGCNIELLAHENEEHLRQLFQAGDKDSGELRQIL